MNLRSYLAAENVTPAAFAEAIHVSAATLYRYLAGHRLPRRDVMERIASATSGSVQPNDFFGITSASTGEAA